MQLGLLLLAGLLAGCPAGNNPTVAVSYPAVATSSCNFVVSVSLENTGLPLVYYTFPLDILFDTGGASPVIYSKLIFNNTTDTTIDIENSQARVFTLSLGHSIHHIHDPKKDVSVLNSGAAFFKSNDIIFDYPNNRIGIRLFP